MIPYLRKGYWGTVYLLQAERGQVENGGMYKENYEDIPPDGIIISPIFPIFYSMLVPFSWIRNHMFPLLEHLNEWNAHVHHTQGLIVFFMLSVVNRISSNFSLVNFVLLWWPSLQYWCSIAGSTDNLCEGQPGMSCKVHNQRFCQLHPCWLAGHNDYNTGGFFKCKMHILVKDHPMQNFIVESTIINVRIWLVQPWIGCLSQP